MDTCVPKPNLAIMALRVSNEEFEMFLRRVGKDTRARAAGAEKKPSKYRNHYVYDGDDVFHSKGEYARYKELQLQEQAGLIVDLKRQVRIPIVVNSVKICDYVADFVYWREGVEVVEDFKGAVTEVYSLKKKLLAACCGKEIQETRKRK